ncbi:hypothetical protein [Haliea sp. E17]|uniref:hypothetical protein n=1 Tax=Haliea sp. E17 TaxID=3401576 RepID=UPI003AAD27C6
MRDLLNEAPREQRGAVVPLALQQLLRADLDVSQDWETAEQILLQAREALPECLEIQVALYKLYAYSNRFEESLALITTVQASAACREGFDADWRMLQPESAAWYPAEGAVRHYLYALKAMGFVSLRRGDLATANAVLAKLASLDPRDQVGGSVVLEMAERLNDE